MIFLLRKRPFRTMEGTGYGEMEPPGQTRARAWSCTRIRHTAISSPAGNRSRPSSPGMTAHRSVFDDSPFYFATERPWGLPNACVWRSARS